MNMAEKTEEQLLMVFKEWLDAEIAPVPNDETPIYAVIQYKDGVLMDHVYRMRGEDSYSGVYKKVRWWMPVEELPKLPPGEYAIKDFYNPGDATKAIK